MICSSAPSRLAAHSAALSRPDISSGAVSTAATRASSRRFWSAATRASRCCAPIYKSSYVKQYEKDNLLLRTETCPNDTYHLNIGRKLANLPALKQRLAATTDRYFEQQAELHHRHRCPGQAGGAGDGWLTPRTRHQTAR